MGPLVGWGESPNGAIQLNAAPELDIQRLAFFLPATYTLRSVSYTHLDVYKRQECGRTYPDVQSLLLLSNVFGVTVDSLIKGDVETMAQVMNEAVKKYNALSTITVVSAVVFLVLSAWAAFQLEWGWGMHIAPTAAFAAVALVVMLVAFVYMERMKKQHDLVTYREVLAFSRGEQVERDTLEMCIRDSF